MANLPEVGFDAVIKNLPTFNAGAKAIEEAYSTISSKADQVGRSTEQMGLKFDEAVGRWRNASGQFASNAQMVVAGVENLKKKTDEANKSADNTRGSFINFDGILKGIVPSLSYLNGQFVNLGQSVLTFGGIAGGAALVGVTALTAGVVALGASALAEFSKFERMSLSIQNLVAREISQGQVVEQQIQTRISLTKKENEELAGLPQKIQDETLSRATLSSQIQEQKQRIIELTSSYGENGLNVQTAKNRLTEMENEYSKSGTEIDKMNTRMTELNNKNGQLTITLEKVRTGQMSMSDAMTQASPKAAELLKWIQLLGIESPFTSEGIQAAFQTAMAYGFTSDEAKRLTEAEVDFSAATGKSVEATNLISLALGQMRAKGKLSAQELNQLSGQGVGVNKILEDMGFTLKDVENGLVPVDKFIEATIADMEIFKGSAKDQANTFSGLTSSLEEIKSVSLREFFTGTFKEIQPYLKDFVQFLSDATFKTGAIKNLGITFGSYVGGGLKIASNFIKSFQGKLSKLVEAFQAGGLFGKRTGSFGSAGLLAALGLSPTIVSEIQSLFNTITGSIQSFMAGGLFGEGQTTGLLSFLGFTPETQETIRTVFDAISSGIQTVTGFLSSLSFNEIIGGLTGIGAVLATGVFAAIVAALFSLLTPINLIIGGAALLGMAWAGNWGGIQEKTAAVWGFVQPILQSIWQWLSVNIPIAIQTVSDIWNNTLLPGFTKVGEAIQTNLMPLFMQFFSWLSSNGPGIGQVLSDAWNNLILPALRAVGDFLLNTLFPAWVDLQVWLATNIPVAIQTAIDFWNIFYTSLISIYDWISGTFVTAFTTVESWLNTINTAIQGGIDGWTNFYNSLLGIVNWINQSLITTFTNIYLFLTSNLLSAISLVSNTWNTVFLPPLVAIGNFMTTVIYPLFQSIANLISAVVNVALTACAGLWQNVLYPALSAVGDYINTTLGQALTTLEQIITIGVIVAVGACASIWNDVLKPALTTIGDYINNILTPVFTTLRDTIVNNVNKAISDLSLLWTDKLHPALTLVGNYINTVFISLLNSIKDSFTDVNTEATSVWSTISEKVSPIIKTLVDGALAGLKKSLDGIIKAIKDATSFFNSLANAVKNFELPEVLTPGSPSPMEISLRGIARAADLASYSLRQMQSISAPSSFDKLFNIDRSIASIANVAKYARGELEDYQEKVLFGNSDARAKLIRETLEKIFNVQGEAILSSDNPIAKMQELLFQALPNYRKANITGDQMMKSAAEFLKAAEKGVNIFTGQLQDALIKGSKVALQTASSLNSFAKEQADYLNSQVESLQSALGIDEERSQQIEELSQNLKDETLDRQTLSTKIEEQKQKVAELTNEYGESSLNVRKEVDKLAEMENEYSKNEISISKLTKQIEELTVASQGVETVDFEGKILSAAEAQDLLNQKLLEQKQIQDDIIKVQQQESKLNFLIKQLDLITMLKSAGLDVKSVLGNVGLGLNASIPDMIEATNNVISAIINQVDTDLQNINAIGGQMGNSLTSGLQTSLGIGSPSKVMIGLAKQTVGDFVNTLSSLGPAIQSSLNRSIVVPAAQASVSSPIQNTTNYNFPMHVTTTASAQATIQQYQIAKAMV